MKKIQQLAGLVLLGIGAVSELLVLMWVLSLPLNKNAIGELWWLVAICMTIGIALVGMGMTPFPRAIPRRLLAGFQIAVGAIVALSRLLQTTGAVTLIQERSPTAWFLLLTALLYGLLLFIIAHFSTRSSKRNGVTVHRK